MNRDENGWRIPRKETLAFQVYTLTKAGKKPREIAKVTGTSVNSIRVLKWRMVHPADANKRELAGYHARRQA